MTIREQIGLISSPSFTTVYPKIYNSERIPSNVASMLEPIWQNSFYKGEPVKIFRFSDVYVAGQGLILDSNLRVISESVSQHAPSELFEAADQVRNYIEGGVLQQTVHEDSMVLVKPGWFNYGHWLIELLPHPFLVEQANIGVAPQIFLPKTDTAIAMTHKQSLALVGVDRERIIDYDFAPRLFKSLILVTGHCRHGPFMSPVLFGALARCRDRVVEFTRGASRRIYVKRNSSSARGISNYLEVEAYLADCGFESVSPENLTLVEQIQLFADCAISIGVAGAGLTNICWQRPGSACIALYPDSMPDTFFWWICQHRGIRWADVRYSATPRGGYEGWNGDIEVSIADLEGIIRRIERGGI